MGIHYLGGLLSGFVIEKELDGLRVIGMRGRLPFSRLSFKTSRGGPLIGLREKGSRSLFPH